MKEVAIGWHDTGRTCGCPADDAEEPGGSGTSQLAHVVIVEDDSGPWSSES